MVYGSVCSGIEAASVAWHPLGWTPAWFCEIEPFPSAVLKERYPHVENYGDFTRLSEPGHPVQSVPIDILVGGTPCQAFSVAGLREGLRDPRGGLTLEYVRLARALRPRWIVWENVPGVLSSGQGRDFGAFVGALVESGYGIAWRVLDAQYFGLAQRRCRVFVVAHSGGDSSRCASVLFEPESMRRNHAPSREEEQDVPFQIAPCLETTCHDYSRADGFVMIPCGDEVRRLTPTECERLQGFPDGWTQIPWKKKSASECPDGPRYKALGNSMAVNCMRWIGRRIELVEKT